MKFEGHYDQAVNIAWIRFEGYDPSTAVAEEAEFGLRELDPQSGRVVGLEYWHASRRLPQEFLAQLPAPAPPVETSSP